MFQKIINGSVRMVQRWLPEPFIFAIVLTLVAAVVAMPICRQTPLEVLEHWGGGVWNLLTFAMQMALVLVCGATLAAAPVIKKGISQLARIPKTPAAAIALVTAVSAMACWLNWGFGLIVGVIFAKEIARTLRGVDYRLLIASAYSGFVVWHAGLSGSIPLTMATPGDALRTATNGILTEPVPVSHTILDPHNLVMVALVTIAIVAVNTLMHPKHGVVSEEVVRVMAESARKQIGTDFAIATSGIAGPTGGSAAKPVGTVWMAWATPKGTTAECFHLGKLREQITDRACTKALVGLLKILNQKS